MCQITILKFFSLGGKVQNSDLAHFLEDETTFLGLSHIYLNYRKVASSRLVYYSILNSWPKVTVHKHQISPS